MKQAKTGLKTPIAPEMIKTAREVLGESQWTFAGRLGVNQATISRWEAGHLPQRGSVQVLLARVLQDIDRIHPLAARARAVA